MCPAAARYPRASEPAPADPAARDRSPVGRRPLAPTQPGRRRRSAVAPRRSSSARSATGSSRASIAATSSRSTSAGRLIRSIGDPDRRRHPPLVRQAVRPAGPGRGRRDRGVRPLAGRAGDHGQHPTPARTSTSGRSRASSAGRASARRSLACGNEGMPLDALTAARLARDGEKAGPIRHMCSGQHSVDDPAGPAARLAARGLLAARPPGPGRLPGGRRARPSGRRPTGSSRRSTAAGSRRTRSRSGRGRPGVRLPGRSGRGPGGRSRGRAAGGLADDRSATRCWPTPRWSPARATGSTRR